MNFKQIVHLQEYKDDKLQIDNNEINKKVIKKIERKKYKDNLLSYKNKIRFSFQGLTWINLMLLSINVKFNSLFFKGTKEEKQKNKLEIKYFISKKWESRKKMTETFNTSVKKNARIEIKTQYKQNLEKKYTKFSLNKKIIRDNKILITADDKMHQDKYSNLTKTRILEFKKQLNQEKNNLKTNNELSKIEKKIELNNIKSQWSYDAYLKMHLLQIKKVFLEKKEDLKIDFGINLNKISETVTGSIDLGSQKKELRSNYWKSKLNLFKELLTFKNNRKFYKQKNYEIRNIYKNDMYALKIKDENFKKKMDIKHLKQVYRQNLRSLKLEFKSRVIEINAQVPIKVSKWKKYISTISNLLLPGIGQILNRQYIKGLLMLLFTAFTWILLMYAFGFGNIEGEGILGLISLGHADNLWEQGDARYFIIEGSLGVIFVSLVVVYNIFAAKSIWHTCLAIENGARVKTWQETKTYMSGIGYPIVTSLPTFIMVLFIVVVPIVTTFLLAFTDYKPNNSTNFEWSGLDIFKGLFTSTWMNTIKFVLVWTFVWTIVTWISAFIIAFALATTLNNERVKGKLLFRLIYMLPWAIPGFITILLFKLMFMPGSILSQLFGNDTFQSDPMLAKISILMIQMWSGYCINLVLITGILQSIPKDLYEAADIDGSSSFNKMWKITLPLIIYQMTPILIGQFMGSFNNFGIIYLYLDGGPYFTDIVTEGGAGATDTIASLIYKLISGGYVARASAFNVIVSLFIVSISVGLLIRSKSVKGGVA